MVKVESPETSTLLMFNLTAHQDIVQEGKIVNLRRRVRRHSKALVDQLRGVKDGRDARGKRYQLWQILGSLFLGLRWSSACFLFSTIQR